MGFAEGISASDAPISGEFELLTHLGQLVSGSSVSVQESNNARAATLRGSPDSD
jgi:hypothetical protein